MCSAFCVFLLGAPVCCDSGRLSTAAGLRGSENVCLMDGRVSIGTQKAEWVWGGILPRGGLRTSLGQRPCFWQIGVSQVKRILPGKWQHAHLPSLFLLFWANSPDPNLEVCFPVDTNPSNAAWGRDLVAKSAWGLRWRKEMPVQGWREPGGKAIPSSPGAAPPRPRRELRIAVWPPHRHCSSAHAARILFWTLSRWNYLRPPGPRFPGSADELRQGSRCSLPAES